MVVFSQRGSKECELNRLQACAMNVIPGAYNYYYPFIYCTEVIVSEGKTTEDWLQCLEVGNQYKDSIYKCFTNGLGEKVLIHLHFSWLFCIFTLHSSILLIKLFSYLQLQLHNAKVTASLNPHLEFVPWVTVNDLPIRHVICSSLSQSLLRIIYGESWSDIHLQDTRNFIRYVCKAYRRGAVPYACRGEIRS